MISTYQLLLSLYIIFIADFWVFGLTGTIIFAHISSANKQYEHCMHALDSLKHARWLLIQQVG